MTSSAPALDRLATYLDQLTAAAAADSRVIGLVLAGSSAQPERRDRWSDHDFLLVTEDGTPEEYRTSPDPIIQQFINGRSSGPMETPGF